MDAKIIEFAALLRQNGLRVSVAEDMDAFHALELLGLGDRGAFKDALRASIVKRAIDTPVFDELFDLYFGGIGQVLKGSASALMSAMHLGEGDFQDLLDALGSILEALEV